LKQEAEAAQHQGDALQAAQGAGQFLQRELHAEGDEEHDGDPCRADRIAQTDEGCHRPGLRATG